MHVNKAKHKVVGKDILYFNGIKWLVRETCKNNKEAKDKYKELKKLKNLKDV